MINLEWGLDRILNEDRKSQEEYFKIFSESRYIDIDYMFKIKAFFVPNHDYMVEYFGTEILTSDNGCYYDGDCVWAGKVVIPIRNSLNKIVGLIGYDPVAREMKRDKLNGVNTELVIPPKYTYSNSRVFDRSSFLFIPNGYKKMIEDNYAIVVDGVFDAITLGSLGYSSACNLGSSLNDKTLFILSMVDRRLIPYDNDEAGINLYRNIRKALPRTEPIIQGKYKDIDEFIEREGYLNLKSKLDSAIKSQILLPVSL